MPERVSKDQCWDMVKAYPEYADGRLTEEQAEQLAEHLYETQHEIVKQAAKTEIFRELTKMVNRGEAEYDPATDRYRYIGER